MTEAAIARRESVQQGLLRRFHRLIGSREQPAKVALQTILDGHLALDHEIDKTLTRVMRDTEVSAMSIIGQVRQLHTTANRLVADLDGSGTQAQVLQKEMSDSVAYVVDIGYFIADMPAKMHRDMDRVQDLSKEIKDLGGIVNSVHAISMQSHLLAINAAIQASHVGTNGAAFRVVADEMRKLASDCSAAAAQISKGLARAQHVVEDGMAVGIAESAQQLSQVAQAGSSIQKLLDNFESMNRYYKERFSQASQHNEALAGDIAEVLGQIQFQDVVRQCIERIQAAVEQRNACLQNAGSTHDRDGANSAKASALLAVILQHYLAEEAKHTQSIEHTQDTDGALKVELF